jgi:hypothetical protein
MTMHAVRTSPQKKPTALGARAAAAPTTSVAHAPAPAPKPTARVKVGPFSVAASEEWTISTLVIAGASESSPEGAGMLTAKAAKPFQKNIVANLEQVPSHETCESYLKRQNDLLKQAGIARTEIGAPERVALSDGREALLSEQTVLGLEGRRIRQLQLVAIRGGLAHHVVASHLDGKLFEKSRAEFRQMLLSFA